MKHALSPFLLRANLHFLRKVREHVHQGHVSKFRLQQGVCGTARRLMLATTLLWWFVACERDAFQRYLPLPAIRGY